MSGENIDSILLIIGNQFDEISKMPISHYRDESLARLGFYSSQMTTESTEKCRAKVEELSEHFSKDLEIDALYGLNGKFMSAKKDFKLTMNLFDSFVNIYDEYMRVGFLDHEFYYHNLINFENHTYEHLRDLGDLSYSLSEMLSLLKERSIDAKIDLYLENN